jgi:hypothetical protein
MCAMRIVATLLPRLSDEKANRATYLIELKRQSLIRRDLYTAFHSKTFCGCQVQQWHRMSQATPGAPGGSRAAALYI